ncbi:hypothetical protein GCM10010423_65080 [Streptomyces levis]|uniref:Uncharacterized protein n=2 Tax=Streptomyces levis TaxID=285566 RepID=A0ABN3P2I4_9ACTN
MPQELRHIWSVEHHERHNAANIFHVYFTTESGLTYLSGFPEQLPAHISTAYGVDATKEDAPDKILDIILHRFHIPEPLHPQNMENDVAFKAGMKKTIVRHPELPPGTVVPTTLYTAEEDEEAIEANDLRLKEVKKNLLYVPYTEVDPKKLRHSAAQMYHVTKEVEATDPRNPLEIFREKCSIPEEVVDFERRAIKQTRLWVHGKDPDPSLRSRDRLGPNREVREKRPRNQAGTRQVQNFRFNIV